MSSLLPEIQQKLRVQLPFADMVVPDLPLKHETPRSSKPQATRKDVSEAVIQKLNKTIDAHDAVLLEMKALKECNEELKELRDSLTDGNEDQVITMAP